jgi:DNA mismatch endonuclease (patch repair protein)
MTPMPLATDSQRSELMSRIKGAHTKPEMLLRRALHARNLRYRLHVRSLPGRPDLVFRSRRAVIFVNGCFWHGHACHLFQWPKSNVPFWRSKITRNKERDDQNIRRLLADGWRVLTLWECALRGPNGRSIDEISSDCIAWLNSSIATSELTGPKYKRKRRPR